jgi:hypothetical protein
MYDKTTVLRLILDDAPYGHKYQIVLWLKYSKGIFFFFFCSLVWGNNGSI